jgi:hypothetical protein
MFLIPVGVAVINILLLVFVFPYETPLFLKQKGHYKKLNTIMSKIYKSDMVRYKIDEIQGGDGEDNSAFNVSYGDLFCSPYYRKATFVGITLAAC